MPICDEIELNLRDIPDFIHTWPHDSTEIPSDYTSQFTKCKGGTAKLQVAEYRVKIGYTDYEGLGRPARPRCVVFVDGQTVVFTGADDCQQSGLFAAVIKLNRCQVLDATTLPDSFTGLRIEPYRAHIYGPGASNGLAVICRRDEYRHMVSYGIIRYLHNPRLRHS